MFAIVCKKTSANLWQFWKIVILSHFSILFLVTAAGQKVRSTRHDTIKHDGQLLTWVYEVTSWLAAPLATHRPNPPTGRQQTVADNTLLSLGCIAVLCKYMRPIVAVRVLWSVGRSVTLVSPAKTVKQLRCHLGWELGWAQGTMC